MSDDEARSQRFLAEHVASCDRCAAGDGVDSIERRAESIASLLDVMPAGPSPSLVGAFSAAVLAAAAPLLQIEVRRLYWRRLAAGLGVAVAPLPLVYAVGAWVLGGVYDVLSALTTESMAAWAVGSYAALFALVVALVCASIPLLVERTIPGIVQVPRRSIA